MTIQNAVNLTKTYRPNRFSDADLIRWLSAADGMVWEEIVSTHEGDRGDSFAGYDAQTDRGTTLLVDEPYAEDVYLNYLNSRIDLENAEIAKYNVSSALFNAGWAAYADWYNRTHAPKRETARFRT